MTNHRHAAYRLSLTVLIAITSASLIGCLALGPRTLKVDQVDYARALGDANKREILSMIVGLRYADSPAVLSVSQVIAGYTFTAGAGPVVNSLPNPAGPAVQVTGTATYSDHPTFTFTPTTGESYAKAYIHPLPPGLILPLADGGVPIDLLLRIAVQSIGGLSNAAMLGGPAGNGSPGFFELLAVLRRLQLAGELSIQYKPGANDGDVSLVLGLARGVEAPADAADLARAHELLHLPGGFEPYLISYGNSQLRARSIPIVTRSVLAILSDLGAEIEVPQADIDTGSTKPAVRLVGGETRPTLVIHAGHKSGVSPYASVSYRRCEFWIDETDFDSKYALTVVQDLMALAEETDTSRAPVVTVPAN